MINYVLKKISEVNEESLFDFYKIAFPGRFELLKKYYKWWYRLNNSPCEPLLVTVDDDVIGQMATVPSRIMVNKKLIDACFFIDFAILEKYQGKGAGSILVKAATKTRTAQIAFCNEAALRVYTKLGWNVNTDAKRILRPINPTKWFPVIKNVNFLDSRNIFNFFLNLKLRDKPNLKPFLINKNFNKLLEAFNSKTENNFSPLMFARDNEWFNWRFYDYPFRDQLSFFEFKNNFFIVNLFSKNNIRRVHLIYHFYTNDNLISEMYYLISKWAIDNNYDLIWSCTADEKLIQNLNSLMPKRLLKSIIITTYSSNKEIFDNLKHKFSNIQAADSDMDILYLEK